MKKHKVYQWVMDKYKGALTAMIALGAKIFGFDPENLTPFAPFATRKDEAGRWKLDSDKLTFLVTLMEVLWKGKGGELMSMAERSVLLQLIPLFYEQTSSDKVPTLTWFCQWLKMYDELMADDESYIKLRQHFDVDQFLLVLKPFFEGDYSALLNGEEDIDISSQPLVYFDVGSIQSNKMVYEVVVLLIIELILDQVRRFPEARKYIYMDECWSLLRSSMGEFIENMYRTVRKNNGSITIITQGVDEIIQSEVGSAIITNASTSIILPHTDKVQIKKLGEVFGYTDHEIDKISSLKKHKNWREVFIKQDDYGRVYRVEVSPEMTAVLSSKPEDRNHLNHLIAKKNGNIHHALNQYIEDQQKIQDNGTDK